MTTRADVQMIELETHNQAVRDRRYQGGRKVHASVDKQLEWLAWSPTGPRAQHPRERFASRYVVDPDTGCWNWTYGLSAEGYGLFYIKEGATNSAYFYSYILHKRPVPDGLELDHLCRNKRCVNPDHLEPVTHRVNIHRANGPVGERARKTQCIRGHDLTGAHPYIARNGTRHCRACRRYYRAAAKEARQHGS